MDVLLVEDDEYQANAVEEALKANFAKVNVTVTSSESEFRRIFSGLRAAPPDLVLMDMFVRWARPAPDMPNPPEEAEGDGFYQAGLRCLRMLLADPKTSKIPTILYSVADREQLAIAMSDMPRHVLFVQKEADDRRLIRDIRSLLRDPPAAKKAGLGKQVWDSINLSPGWFGFGINLKRLLGKRDEPK